VSLNPVTLNFYPVVFRNFYPAGLNKSMICSLVPPILTKVLAVALALFSARAPAMPSFSRVAFLAFPPIAVRTKRCGAIAPGQAWLGRRGGTDAP
jgi:hypothetical protein